MQAAQKIQLARFSKGISYLSITHILWTVLVKVVEYSRRSSYARIFAVCEFSFQKAEKVFKSHSQFKMADFEEQLEKK